MQTGVHTQPSSASGALVRMSIAIEETPDNHRRPIHLAATATIKRWSIALVHVVCGSSEKPYISVHRSAAPPPTTCTRWLPELLPCQWLYPCWIFLFLKMIMDDMSDDEFDGYIDPDETSRSAEGFDDGNGEDSEPSHDVPLRLPAANGPWPSVDMTDKSPLNFFKLLVNDAMHAVSSKLT